MTGILRVTVRAALFLVLILLLLWSALALPVFSGLRTPILERMLSEQIGQTVLIEGEVSIILGATSHIHATKVEVPSETIENVNLAALNVLELELNLPALISGQIDIDNLIIDGLNVRLLTDTDGKQSWVADNRPEVSATALDIKDNTDGILDFLSDKTVTFTSVALKVNNETTGFEFDFELANLYLDQLGDDAGATVTSQGTVNGQSFQIEGDYPRGQAFTTHANFGEMTLDFNGTPITTQNGGGFEGKLTLDTGEIGDLLELLRLDRDLEGQASLTADIKSQHPKLKISDISSALNLAGGELLTAKGSVEDLIDFEGVDLAIDGRFYPQGNSPETATDLKDLRLTNLSTQIIGAENALEFQDLTLTTNAFDNELKQIGPVRFGRVFRADNGNLMLEDITLQAGPQDRPYLTAKGNIKDLLRLREIDFSGTMSIPASLFFQEQSTIDIKSLGSVEGSFSADDLHGFLSLNKFDAHTVDTEIWQLKTQAKLGNVNDFEDLSFDLDLEVKNSAQFLAAIGRKTVKAGPFKLSLSAQGKQEDFSSMIALTSGNSTLSANLETSTAGARPVTKGKVSSQSIALQDIKDAVVFASRIETSFRQPGTTGQKRKGPTGKVTDLIEAEDFLLDQDVDVSVEIMKIEGEQMITSLSSQLSASNGLAQLGPVDVAYDGGHFSATAKMNMVKSPQLLSLQGTIKDWNLATLFSELKTKYSAEGRLHGSFEFTGNRRSIVAYVNSMKGSALILMSNGGISTSLLELSGLGIFPWLISEELRKGYSKITCLAAPIKITAGDVSFSSFVAETKKVQLVAHGDLDWIKNTISIQAEARKLGKPLSRSAWPFEVVGSLTHPKIKLLHNNIFQQRKDGATELPENRKSCVPDISQLR
ncbi:MULTISPECIES: AsmA family protein [unclassified Ruegeria]|uniref:AsmA family protein n=1 Tax=unclassified Ruegeria TaxID=2625375 RepID=UPI00148A04DD|nr:MULTISPECIES: AsmA family protein [unclassified Ruegeria]